MGTAAVSPNSRAWLDNFRISGFLTASEFQMQNELMNAQTFESSGPRNVVGNYTHSHALTVFWDGGTSDNSSNDMDAMLYGIGASDGVHYLAETRGVVGAAGDLVTESPVKLASKPHRGSNGQLQSVNLALTGAGGIVRGKILANTIATATGTYSSQSQSTYALALGRSYQAVVRVPQVVGSSWSITVEVESSSDGNTWATMPGMNVTRTTPGVSQVSFTTNEIKAFARARVSAINLSTATTGIPFIVTAGTVQN